MYNVCTKIYYNYNINFIALERSHCLMPLYWPLKIWSSSVVKDLPIPYTLRTYCVFRAIALTGNNTLQCTLQEVGRESLCKQEIKMDMKIGQSD